MLFYSFRGAQKKLARVETEPLRCESLFPEHDFSYACLCCFNDRVYNIDIFKDDCLESLQTRLSLFSKRSDYLGHFLVFRAAGDPVDFDFHN